MTHGTPLMLDILDLWTSEMLDIPRHKTPQMLDFLDVWILMNFMFYDTQHPSDVVYFVSVDFLEVRYSQTQDTIDAGFFGCLDIVESYVL